MAKLAGVWMPHHPNHRSGSWKTSNRQRNETLAECALQAPRLAAAYCDHERGCRLHHAVWPTLRLLELVGSPGAPEDIPFWRRVLGAISSASEPRVLLSGASDHGFLELIYGLLAEAAIRAKLSLVDRCETPLRLNRWYAERAGIDLEIFQSDILSFAPEQPFDAVLAHAFIDQLPSDQWPTLLAKWRELLRPGGYLVSLNRVRSAPEAEAERAAVAAPIDAAAMIRGGISSCPLRFGCQPSSHRMSSATGGVADRRRFAPKAKSWRCSRMPAFRSTLRRKRSRSSPAGACREAADCGFLRENPDGFSAKQWRVWASGALLLSLRSQCRGVRAYQAQVRPACSVFRREEALSPPLRLLRSRPRNHLRKTSLASTNCSAVPRKRFRRAGQRRFCPIHGTR